MTDNGKDKDETPHKPKEDEKLQGPTQDNPPPKDRDHIKGWVIRDKEDD